MSLLLLFNGVAVSGAVTGSGDVTAPLGVVSGSGSVSVPTVLPVKLGWAPDIDIPARRRRVRIHGRGGVLASLGQVEGTGIVTPADEWWIVGIEDAAA